LTVAVGAWLEIASISNGRLSQRYFNSQSQKSTRSRDRRTVPCRSSTKFAAKMAALGGPYLFYEVVGRSHGPLANLRERAQTVALQSTYFVKKLMD